MSKLVKVVLHGALARAVGRSVWKLALETPGECIRAIEAQTGKLLHYLSQRPEAEYVLLADKESVNPEHGLTEPREMEELHLIPLLSGSAGKKQGKWFVIIGVMLIVTGILIAGTGIGGVLSPLLINLGIGLIMYGISLMLLKPPPKRYKPSDAPSFVFTGGTNVMKQGNPIPVAFGILLVGSQVISASLTNVDIEIPAGTYV